MANGKIGDRGNLGNFFWLPDTKEDATKTVERLKPLLIGMVKDVDKEAQRLQSNLLKKQLKEEKQSKIDALKESAKLEGNLFKKNAKMMKATLQANLNDLANNFSERLGKALTAASQKFISSASSSINSYISTYSQYMGTISARLQGTNLTYNTLLKDVSKNLSVSPYVTQTSMIENLNKFVQSGVAYNLELRSYLATVSDRIATTFDAFDSSLLRIIRIQQADSTRSRLGMEAMLTKFLNAQFENTEYLQQTANSVSNMLIEAESQMGYKGATEFEYVVQKWLGSLGAVGVSENTLQTIATGLGYLGSGNISALSSNESLQNLLVMAASRTPGLDYGRLLTGGLTAQDANALMSSLVGFGREIASSGSNVVRSQYAQIFGLTISDLTSLLNLSTEDLNSIATNMLTYSNAIKETENQLGKLSERTSISQKVSNVISNLMTNVAAGVATNAGLYGTWEAANLLASSGLDYTFEAAPFGVGMSSSLSQIMKTGVIGISGITSLVSMLGNIGKDMSGTSLSVWGGSDTTSRGKGLNPYGTTGRTKSASTYIGSADAGAYTGTFAGMAEQTASYTGEQSSETQELMEVIRDDIAVTLREKIAVSLNDLYSEFNDFYTKWQMSPSAFGLSVT